MDFQPFDEKQLIYQNASEISENKFAEDAFTWESEFPYQIKRSLLNRIYLESVSQWSMAAVATFQSKYYSLKRQLVVSAGYGSHPLPFVDGTASRNRRVGQRVLEGKVLAEGL
ncbi:hypothetical protein [Halostagnicola kamekurae]|nr:hypothetical protein [Halostagnicola kamekurae]